MKKGIAVAWALVLLAPLARAEETRILGVQFSKEGALERLRIQSAGPLPAFSHQASRQDMTVAIQLRGSRLAGDSVRVPLPDSVCLRSAQLSPSVDSPGNVELVLRLERWAPYTVVEQDGSLVVELDTSALPLDDPPGDPAAQVQSMQEAVAGPGQSVASEPLPTAATSTVLKQGEEPGARRLDRPEDFGLRGGEYDRVVSLDFREQTVEDVIRLIASKGKINILFDPTDLANRRITLHLEEVKLGEALENILRVNQLAYVQEKGGILRVVPGSQVGRKEVELKTEVIVLNWVKAADLKDALRPFVSDAGAIEANEENNSLVVTDTPPSLEQLRGLVDKLDEPEKQVMIEIHLVDVLQDYAKSHGVKWNVFPTASIPVTETVTIPAGQIPDPNNPGQFIPDPLNPAKAIEKIIGSKLVPKLNDLWDAADPTKRLAAPARDSLGVTAPLATAAGEWALGQPFNLFGDGYWLNATIQADASKNHAQILANPRVITLNNLEAKIRIEEQIPYLSGELQQQQAVLTVTFKQAGEEISVTPTITSNGYVRMVIMVKQMIFRGRVGPDPLAPPKIDEREATTNVIVRDGTTIALGGLEGHRVLDNATGIPWLMDIPVLRWAFQSKATSVSKSTLYLFVRPKIVEVEASELTEDEKFWFDGVQRNWNMPDEYFDDWRGVGDEKTNP